MQKNISQGLRKFDWFEPINVGAIQAKNRIFMASLTRNRGDPATGVGNDTVIEYYKQRAGFGIIFSEASQISQRGHGYPGACGLETKEQTEFWKKCVKAVHNEGGKFVAQLWHVGRATDASITGGVQPLSSSPFAVNEVNRLTGKNYPVPKEMTLQDIQETLQEYRRAAENAKEAGFDGVELHGANGYLPDQFLKDGINKRTDHYGGSVENRIRFTLEAIDQLIAVYGADRVGIKLSPTGRFLDQFDSNPLQTYSALISELEKRKIAFIQLKETGDIDQAKDTLQVRARDQIPDCCEAFRSLFSGTLIQNDGFKITEGVEKGYLKAQQGFADAMSFGRIAISNPDLPERIRNNWPINYKIDFKNLFAPGPQGYTDYPFYNPENK